LASSALLSVSSFLGFDYAQLDKKLSTAIRFKELRFAVLGKILPLTPSKGTPLKVLKQCPKPSL